MNTFTILAAAFLLLTAQTYPQQVLTPGAVNPKLTKAVLCSPDFTTRTYRHTTAAMKHKVCVEYHATGKCPDAKRYEVDHRVPLFVGGADTLPNLGLEEIAEAKKKDRLENRAHPLVCSGKWTLQQGQDCFLKDWRICYKQVFGVAP